MSNKLLSIFCFSYSILLAASCNKNSDEHCPITVANISGSYGLESVKYKLTASASEIDYLDEFVDFKDCTKDDILSFKTNGVFLTIDSGITCTPPSNDSTNWRIDGNKLIIELGEEYFVEKLDCENKQLILKYKDFEEDGDEIRIFLRKQ